MTIKKDQALAFLATYDEAIRLASPRSEDEDPDVVSARFHALLVAAAWCLLMMHEQLSDEIWAGIAVVALKAAREREAMRKQDEKGTLQ